MPYGLPTSRGRDWFALFIAAGMLPSLACAGGQSETIDFNPAFLNGGSGRAVDLRRFSVGNTLAAGVYRAEVTLNDKSLGMFDVELRVDPEGRQNVACLADDLVRRLSIDPSKAPEALRRVLLDKGTSGRASGGACRFIGDIAEGASARFDPSEQRLDLTIPQLYLIRSARGYVPPERWESGIAAGLLTYHYSDFRVSGPASTAQQFLGLRGGVNLGDWRLRHDGSLVSNDSGRHYQAVNTSVQRDVTSLLSTLTVGDSTTDGQLFEGVGLRGIQLATDDRMLPDSMRGYAPVIRGEARTNARVTIRQNSTVLYETVVPPGPFAISDLFPMASGSDLQVTITEADGSQRVTVVPYSPLPQLLREGAKRWSVDFGQVRNLAASANTPLLQATFQQGINNSMTAGTGLQLSRDYASVLAGAAFNTSMGAFALDATFSRFNAPELGLRRGASFRLSYAKYLPSTGTAVTFAAYRESTVNYYSLRDAMQAEQAASSNFPTATSGRSRQRAVLSVNQPLGGSAAVVLSAYSQNYWNRAGTDRTYQLSVSRYIGRASLSLSLARNLPMIGAVTSTRVSLMLNMPLDRDSQWSTSSQLTRDSGSAGMSLQTGVSGTVGENRQYSVSLSDSHSESGNTVSVGGGYRGDTMTISGNLSRGPSSTQASIMADGGVVVHPGGVSFVNTLGDTVGIVYAPSAPGASVQNSQGSHVNSDGYAVIPYLTPYAVNTVELDMNDAPIDSQLDSTVGQVVPRNGAVVLLEFKGRRARSVLIDARGDDGKALPFSATVTDESGRAVGLVGQGGRIEANVSDDKGRLTVRWGDEPADQCTLAYRLPAPEAGKTAQFIRLEGVCRKAENETYSETNKKRNVQ